MNQPRWVVLPLLSAGLLVGCIREYRFPTQDQPHAVLKVRRVYETRAGTKLTEQVLVNSHRALAHVASPDEAETARIDAMLIHPVPARIEVQGAFTHREMKFVDETYTEQVPYTEQESYDCSTGYGSSRSYRTCYRTVTKYRSEMRHRTVTKEVDVSDGACEAPVWLAAQTGAAYLVQFDYHGPGNCTASCYQQVPLGDSGRFENRPCPEPTGQEKRDLRE